MNKSLNCVQVLTRAKDTIQELKSQQVDQEQTKKALLFKRAKLFEEFVQKLNSFPAAVKKKALLETKEMLKKIKEQRHDTAAAQSKSAVATATAAPLAAVAVAAPPQPAAGPPATVTSATVNQHTVRVAALILAYSHLSSKREMVKSSNNFWQKLAIFRQ